MNNDNLRRVHKTLLDNGYTPPTYEEFENDMQDDNNLRGVYETLKKEGYTPPEYEQFRFDMGFAKVDADPNVNDNADDNGNDNANANPNDNANPNAKPWEAKVAGVPSLYDIADKQREETPKMPNYRHEVSVDEEGGKISKPVVKWQPDKAERAEVEKQMTEMRQNIEQSKEDIDTKNKYIGGLTEKPFDTGMQRIEIGNTESVFQQRNPRVVETDAKYNTETGEFEKGYINEAGEYNNKAMAERDQKQIDRSRYIDMHPDYAGRANRNQVANMDRYIDDNLREAQKESAEIIADYIDNASLGALALMEVPKNPMMGGVDTDGFKLENIPTEEAQAAAQRIREFEAASRSMRDAKRIIAEADRAVKEDKYDGWLKRHTLDFAGGVARGFGDKFFDIDTWDFGLTDIKDNSSLMLALDKADKGEELTESQRALLDAKAIELATQAYFGSQVGKGYNAGAVTAESIPFMLEMCINPAASAGTTAASKMARYALKRFAKKAVTEGVEELTERGLMRAAINAGKKNLVKRAALGGRITGDLVAGAGVTATTGSGRVLADTMDRMAGEVKYDENELGLASYAGRENQKEFGEAFAKAFASGTIENYSEMVGEYFSPILGVAGKYIGKGLDKMKLGFINDAIENISASKLAKAVNDFESHAKYSGSIGEFSEEIAGGILNAIFVGDQTLDTNEQTGVFNPDNLIDTYLGVSIFGGVMSGVKTFGYRTPKYRAKQNMVEQDKIGSAMFGNQDKWGQIRNTIAVGSEEDIAAILQEVKNDDSLTQEQKMQAFKYAAYAMNYKGVLMAEQKRREEQPREHTDFETSFDNGYSLEGQEMNDAMNMYDMQREKAVQVLGDDKVAELDANPVDAMAGIDTEEQLQVATDYVNAKATFDGMGQKVLDDINAQIAESTKNLNELTSKTDGKIHPVTLKGERKAHIVDGNVAVTDNGEIDAANSDLSILVRDDETGKIEFVSPSDIVTSDGAIDAEEEKANVAQAIRDAVTQQADAQMNGILSFNVGDEYDVLDDEGNAHTIAVVDNGQEGQVLVSVDGENVARMMPRDEVQKMANNANLARLAEHEAKKETKKQMGIGETSGEADNNNVGADEPLAATPDAMPMIKNSEDPDFMATTPERGHRYLYDEAGIPKAAADNMVTAHINAAEKEVKKQSDALAKLDANPGTSISAYKAKQADIKGKLDAAQTAYDYWNGVKTEQGKRDEAERQAAFAAQTADASGRQNELAAQKTPKEKIDAAKQMYGEYFDSDFTVPYDAMELVAMNMPNEKISWEGREGVRGLQQELGSNFKRGVGRDRGTNAFNIYLAKKGEGISTDEAIHSIYESAENTLPNGEHRWDVEEIRGAFIDMFMGAEKPSDIRDYVLNNRIRQAEQMRAAEDEAAEMARLDDEIMQRTGMEREEYAAWIAELEARADAQAAYENEVYNETNTSNDRETEGSIGEEGSGQVQGQEGDTTGVEEDGAAGVAEREETGGERLWNNDGRRSNGGSDKRQGSVSSSDELDENGIPFVKAEDGTTQFGEIRDTSGLAPAPIRLSMGFHDSNTNKGYGLEHIEAKHGEQIREAGFGSVEEFVRFVALHYEEDNIRVGKRRNGGSTTYLIQVTDKHDNTLFIEMSRDGSYWNVNSGGVFRKGYSNKKETVTKTEPQQPNNAVSTGSSRPADGEGGIASTEPNGKPTVSSASKGTENFETDKETEQKFNKGERFLLASGAEITIEDVDDKGERTFTWKSINNDNVHTSKATIEELEVMGARPLESVQESVAKAEKETDTNPTEGQKKAGNYKKGHVKIDGYDVSIEQPKGSVRSGVDANGKKWEQTMNNTYGYIRGTEGVDGDHIDVFLSDNIDDWNGMVYVVDQVNNDGSFDEHKVMYGFNSAEEARAAYLLNYEEGWQGLGTMTGVTKEEFKKWVESSHRKTKPFAEYKSVQKEEGQNESTINGAVDMTTMQPVMSEEAFAELLESGDREMMEAYLKEIEHALRLGDNAPLDGKKEVQQDYKKAVEQYGKDNIPEEVLDELTKRIEPYNNLERTLFDRKYALEEKLRGVEAAERIASAEKKDKEKAAHKQTAYNGFLADKTALGADAAEKALSKRINIEGEVMTVAEFVEKQHQSGSLVPSISEEPKYKGVSKRAWNRMDAAQQAAEEERVKNGGTKSVYRLNGYDLGKTAYDYAQYLMKNNNDNVDKAETEKPQKSEKKSSTRASSVVKIDDFGEKIGGARKDLARGRIRDIKGYTTKDLTALKKGADDILSQANILRLYKDGQMDEQTARGFLAMNNAVKVAIKKYGRTAKEIILNKYRDAAVAWEEGRAAEFGITDADVAAYMAGFDITEEKARKDLDYCITETFDMYMLTYQAMNYPAVERKLGQYVIVDYGSMRSRRIPLSRPFWVKTSYTSGRGYPFATLEGAMEKLNQLCPEVKPKDTAKKEKGEKAEHGLRVTKEGFGFYVKSRNIPGNIYLSPKFTSEKQAQAYMEENLEQLKAREQRLVDALMGSNIGMAEREGVDYRNGKDVTPQDFLDEFGFRGVEFGNWVPQGERQMYLNKTYDAIKDFCAIVGISPKAFSLGGRLGLAFGARGSGRALAHYEPGKEAINLTRMSGVGSLAHEWFHALDNILAKQETGNTSDMATMRYDVVREEVSAVLKEMYRAMKAMDYDMRSRRAGEYWGRTEEEFARLFENYIYNKLAEKEVTSPILVRKDILFDDAEEVSKNRWPYPSVAENATMAPLFDKLFSTIQEKTDEKGNVVLFQKLDGSTLSKEADATEMMMRDALIETMEGAGIEVVTDVAIGQQVLDDANGAARLMGGEMSERRKEREEVNNYIDEATSFVTGKDIKDVRRERIAREEQRRELTKEIYGIILSGDFNSVNLQKISDYINDVTPNNPYGRRLSERLPQRVERKSISLQSLSAVDALYGRASESAVSPHERVSAQGRRAIEERKKEALEQWAKATGNWHTDLSDFTDSPTPISDDTTDSDVYMAKDGKHVIKLSRGKQGKRFAPDIDNIPLFNYVFPNSAYKILGYGDFGKGFVRILQQPFVDFETSEPLTEQERVAFMDGLGFKSINKNNTAFSNGEIIVADLQKNNIVKDADGNINVIDADCKLHTKDVGGQYTYLPVEHDMPLRGGVREMRVYHGSGADFDAFDHSHMGEGEGAQAYGWGTYVTEVEGIGKTYAQSVGRNPIGRRPVLYKGESYDAVNTDGWSDEKKGVYVDLVQGMRVMGKSAEQAKDDLRLMTEVNIRNRERSLANLKVSSNTYQSIAEDKRKQEERLKHINEFNADDFTREGSTPTLYTVEIPEENAAYYIGYNERMREQQDIVEMADNELSAQGWRRQEIDERVVFTNSDGKRIVFTPNQSGADFYEEFVVALGSKKAASEFLSSVGITGIKYPAEFRSGGRTDGASNYVIFDESNIEITNKARLFRTSNGEVYGYTMGGKIYLDTRIATTETPIHEYSHLWSEALEQANPKAWEQLKNDLVKDTELMDYVKGLYPEIKDENELMHEVFAHFSGKRGRARLEEMRKEETEKANGILDKARIIAMFHRLKELLGRYWTMARDLFAGNVKGLKKMKAEDFADMAMADLLGGFNPSAAAKNNDIRYQFVGEQGAAEAVKIHYDALAQKYHGKPYRIVMSIDEMADEDFLKEIGITDEELAKLTTDEIRENAKEQKEYTKAIKIGGGYNPNTGKIVIFAENIPSLKETEDTFFHENLHGILHELYGDNPQSIALRFWDAAEKWSDKKSIIAEAYRNESEHRQKEEFFVYLLSRAMLKGRVDDVLSVLTEEDAERVENILGILGYDRQTEELDRRREKGNDRENHGQAQEKLGQDVQADRHRRTVDVAEGGKLYRDSMFRDGGVLPTYEESLASSKAAGYTKRQHDAWWNRAHKNMRLRANDIAKKLHLEGVVDIYETSDDLNGVEGITEEDKKSKGWYDPKTGRIAIILGNHASAYDVMMTMLHEGVAHFGLRQLFGKNFETFLWNVYSNATPEVRSEINKLMAKNGWNYETATEEYLAGLAEDIDFDRVMKSGWWWKIKDWFVKMLRDIGLGSYVPEGKIGDNELRYVLWRSYYNLELGGAYGTLLGAAIDVAKQYELGVGKFAPKEEVHGVAEQTERATGVWAEKAEETTDEQRKKYVRNAIKNYPNTIGVFKGTDGLYHSTSDNIEPFSPDKLDEVLKKLIKSGTRVALIDDIPSVEDGVSESEYLGYKPTLDDYYKYTNATFELIARQFDMPAKTKVISHERTQEERALLKAEWDKLKHEHPEWEWHLSPKSSSEYLIDKETGDIYRYSDHWGKVATCHWKVKGGHGVTEQIIAKANIKDFDRNISEGLLKYARLHRSGDGTQEAYNNAVNTGSKWGMKNSWGLSGYNFREAFQDSMLALRKLQEVVEERYGIKLGEDENAYDDENSLSSRNQEEKKSVNKKVIEPMNAIVDKMISEEGVDQDDLNDYLICKHGLERNVVMAERDARKEYDELVKAGQPADLNSLIKKYRNRDYSGLTGVTGLKSTRSAELAAMKLVYNFENNHSASCVKLWEAINKATKWTLKKGFDSGMMSKETYDKVRNMFQYYVPLRGWDEETAEDVYDYLMNDRSVFNGTVVAAKGHRHKSDDPLAIIANMADSAILQGNRNQMKQKLLNMAVKYPTDVCSVGDMWIVKNGKKWAADFPVIPVDASSEEVAQIVAQHDADMRALGDNAKRVTGKLDIEWHINKKNIPEHAVVVNVGGVQHVVYINGNPRAAQAVNGLTGERRRDAKDKAGRLVDFVLKDMKRWYSSMMTQYNINFSGANYVRDFGHSILMTFINNGLKDTGRMLKYILPAIGYGVKARVGRVGNGEYDKYYKEFLENGGVTGYAHLDSVDKWKHLNDMRWERLSKLQKAGVAPAKVFQAGMEAIGWFSETLELITRFNTYIKERKKGESIANSVKAAKNITVNFNKKGSEVTPGVFGAIANTLRLYRMFFNPIVQGLNQIYEAVSNNPKARKRLIGVCAFYSIIGAVMPFVNMALVDKFGDDDDDDDYFLLNEYTRRTNLVFFTGKGYVKIPLPQFFREFYGMGEAIATYWIGEASDEDLRRSMVGQIENIFSIEGQEGYKEWSMTRFLLFDHLEPIADVENNENFMGTAIWNESIFKQGIPEYQKAKERTWKPLVGLAKEVNELQGGTENVAGEGSNRWNANPAAWQHLLENYGGGLVQFIGDAINVTTSALDGEMPETSNMPFAKRFYTIPTEESANWARYRMYKDFRKDYDRAEAEHTALNKENTSIAEHVKKIVAFEEKQPEAASIYYAWKDLDIAKRLKDAEWNSDEYWGIIREAVDAGKKVYYKDDKTSFVDGNEVQDFEKMLEEDARALLSQKYSDGESRKLIESMIAKKHGAKYDEYSSAEYMGTEYGKRYYMLRTFDDLEGDNILAEEIRNAKEDSDDVQRKKALEKARDDINTLKKRLGDPDEDDEKTMRDIRKRRRDALKEFGKKSKE